MKTLLRLIEFTAWYLRIYGIKGLRSLLIPVGWKQDCYLTNGGYDLICPKHRGYFTGTYWQKIHVFQNRMLRGL